MTITGTEEKMKSIDVLNNTEKAKLVFDLFKNDLENMVNHIQSYTEIIIEQEEQLKSEWTNGLISAEYWVTVAKTVHIICTSSSKLSKDIRTKTAIAADELFYWHNAIVSAQGLLNYKNEDAKQMQLIHLLFN